MQANFQQLHLWWPWDKGHSQVAPRESHSYAHGYLILRRQESIAPEAGPPPVECVHTYLHSRRLPETQQVSYVLRPSLTSSVKGR